ncbi:MAG: 6-carboxytetrahydropterin synthase [bacterium]|nr:6-carboxytetrahydropterin synthase [bacterium]
MMTYEVLVDSGFDARHGICLPDGTIEPAHTHRWEVTVKLVSSRLDSCGLVADFDAVRADLEAVLGRLDDTDLNNNPRMRGLNPTAEHVARVVFEALLERRGGDPSLFSIKVTEAPGCAVVYRRTC